MERVGLGVVLRREGLELLQTARVHVRVRLVQDCELHGAVPPPLLLLHVREARLEAVDALAELDELEAEVDGVLPDLLDPVEDEAEGAVHEGEGRAGHFVGGSCERSNAGKFGYFGNSKERIKKK